VQLAQCTLRLYERFKLKSRDHGGFFSMIQGDKNDIEVYNGLGPAAFFQTLTFCVVPGPYANPFEKCLDSPPDGCLPSTIDHFIKVDGVGFLSTTNHDGFVSVSTMGTGATLFSVYDDPGGLRIREPMTNKMVTSERNQTNPNAAAEVALKSNAYTLSQVFEIVRS
jgi:hypothetical protein